METDTALKSRSCQKVWHAHTNPRCTPPARADLPLLDPTALLTHSHPLPFPQALHAGLPIVDLHWLSDRAAGIFEGVKVNLPERMPSSPGAQDKAREISSDVALFRSEDVDDEENGDKSNGDVGGEALPPPPPAAAAWAPRTTTAETAPVILPLDGGDGSGKDTRNTGGGSRGSTAGEAAVAAASEEKNQAAPKRRGGWKNRYKDRVVQISATNALQRL